MRHAFRALVWLLIRLVYRVRVAGLDNIPDDGPALLAPNHVSFLDAVIIAAHIRRPIAFAMYWKLFDRFAWFLRPLGAFPIAGKSENPVVYGAAMARMNATLETGGLLCVFPEGRLTTDGTIGPFKPGIMKVLERHEDVPVIPVGLRNLWGSYFSRRKPGWFKLPTHFGQRIEMHVGRPLWDASLPTIRMMTIALVHGL